jgi:hypothetical protein
VLHPPDLHFVQVAWSQGDPPFLCQRQQAGGNIAHQPIQTQGLPLALKGALIGARELQ